MSDFSPSGHDAYAAVVSAAQAGDQRALDVLVADHLPLVYNVVGRALNAPSDTDDVVQDVMLQMVRDVGQLRDPAAFRSWLVAIAMRQVRRHWRLRRAAPPQAGPEWLDETARLADPGADFADLTIAVLHLSEQRRETAEATRWLDAEDRELLAVWWMEVAGQLTRAELAAALEIPSAQAGVRVQRLKARLEVARAVVRALEAVPRCPDLDGMLYGWDGRPSGLWRKRVARHTRECPVCDGVFAAADVVPAERLLADLALVPVPPVLAALTAAALRAGGGNATTAVHSTTSAHTTSAAPTTSTSAAHSTHTAELTKAATLTKAASAGKLAALLSLAAAGVAGVTIASVALAAGPSEPSSPTAAALSAPPTARSAPPTASASPAPSASPSPSARPHTTGKPATTAAAAPNPTTADTKLPVRAAFYYPWYDKNPHTDGGSQYTASAPDYDQDEPATVDRQIKDMQYGGLQAGIASWWGAGKREDERMPLLMSEGAKLGFSWTAYYENEAYGNPSVTQIHSDLGYLRKYADQKTWLHIDGKPVIFVYAAGGDGCDMVDRWTEANRTAGYYVVLKVFGGYRTCANQPQGWHQYASSLDLQQGYSAILSPGFYKYDADAPVVPRDLDRFRRDALTVATSGAPFQLLVTYNEWGEGTAAESATAWASQSGHGAYMDVLHEVFTAHPR
ncbi:sigma-70 family RNA polymerase sigma factor [Streptomyces sp. NPDC056683]|uniref:sigma-70 family RNA polymerase sigma factor n=1 Tax=Streptomyces sp. NPDC056683 TaxID=3345910 RepID=UPI00368E9F51